MGEEGCNEIRLAARGGGKVVSHQVDPIEIRMDQRELEIDDVLGPRGGRDRQQIIPAIGIALVVQLATQFL